MLRMRVKHLRVLVVLLFLGALLAACGKSPAKGSGTGAGASQATGGGVLKEAVVGAQWPSLDPAKDTQDVADAEFMNLIYGELFEEGPNGKLLPDIATKYSYANNDLQLRITIRSGVEFSDGHALTAAIVAQSMNRALSQASNFAANFAAVSTPVTSQGNTVILNLKYADAAIVASFIGQPLNWTVDPYALQKMGTTGYGQHPIGAGPFEVTKNSASSELDLVRNPHYWQHGYPKLSGFDILNVGSDDSAYSSLQTGQVQVIGGVGGITTIPLIKQIQSKNSYNVVFEPATTYQFVSMNQSIPPFNNVLAREALTYATNPQALVKGLYGNLYKVVEGPTAPGELFYYGPDVPGYPKYDLAKAKALVKQLGGLTVTLATTSNTSYWEQEASALKGQWSLAGIKTNVELNTLQETLQQLSSGHWQALDSNWGIYVDPGAALPYYFSSKGGASGIHSSALDTLINKAAASVVPSVRKSFYRQIGTYMASHFDAAFLYYKPIVQIASKKVGWLPTYGPSYGEILWQNVYLKS